ncbi:PREDICTED: ribonuclease inhibitor-like [Nanorana parkeri]|uniref:ribonuclease inhibitor-like n=1 Tax=Nanorana parkeri TaxID=125878 RepID=UPI000854BB40|nr:PREDICTED: ribonuclease inhibitor-like [Nanorana parkeri]
MGDPEVYDGTGDPLVLVTCWWVKTCMGDPEVYDGTGDPLGDMLVDRRPVRGTRRSMMKVGQQDKSVFHNAHFPFGYRAFLGLRCLVSIGVRSPGCGSRIFYGRNPLNPSSSFLQVIAFSFSSSFVRCGFAEDTETGGKASWLSNPGSKIQQLEFHVCVVAPSFFEDLRSLISSSQSLTKLVISHHKLEDAIFKILCDSLRQPGCTLRELELNDCNLTAASCEHLGSALKANRSLHKLDLVLNELKDEGVKFICEGLKDPGCTLQELRIEFSELSPACCDYLHSLLMTNRTLTTLYLRECNIQDTGAKRLCQALCKPGCTLVNLW